MKVGFGLKCPRGHFRVQTMIGEPKCPVCGSRLVADSEAADTALNRQCKHCGARIGLNITDTGRCPRCGELWE